jgi:uncharacterized membrane protein YphA (DoxX/SURF4 family)
MIFDEKLNNTWWTLRIALGLAPIVAGLDKFFNLLTNWEAYLQPAVPQLLHVPAVTFMHVVGVIEIVAGIVVLSNFTRLGAYIVMAWLIGIALSLATQGRYFDIAVRDLLISVAAFSLAKLTEVREAALGLERQRHSVASLQRAS